MGCFDAGGGVFENDAVFRIQPQRLSAFQKYLRVGLGGAHHGAVDNGIEQFGQFQLVQDPGGVFTGGAQSNGDAGGFGRSQKFIDAGQDLVFAQFVDVGKVYLVFLVAVGGLVFFGHGASAQLQNDLKRAHSADAFEQFVVLLGEGNGKLLGQVFPGQVMVFGGVYKNTVQIKQKSDRFHGCVLRSVSAFLYGVIGLQVFAARFADLRFFLGQFPAFQIQAQILLR